MGDFWNPSHGDTVTFDTTLQRAPDVAQSLGHLCAAWANVEWQLFLLFGAMASTAGPIARAIYFSVSNLRTKLEMIGSLSTCVLAEETDREQLDSLLARVGRAARTRNKHVHDVWGYTEQPPERIVIQMRLAHEPGGREMEEVRISDLEAQTKHYIDLAGEIIQFGKAMLPKIAASHQKLQQQPNLALGFAKKGSHPGQIPRARKPPPEPSQK